MQLSEKTITNLKADFEYSLPGLVEAIKEVSSDTFLIGASLLDFYKAEGWVADFSRATGDLDFTIEYFGSPDEYNKVCQKLLETGYTKDEKHSYRYHPKKVQGVYAYVDLLAFTTEKELEADAKKIIPVGELFNFEGMNFAKHAPLTFEENIYLPNPLALIFLKMMSYRYNPDRKKDFVDFIEIILRMSTDDKFLAPLKEIVLSCESEKDIKELTHVLRYLEKDVGTPWDIDDIYDDMEDRGLLNEFEWDEIPVTVEFFRTKIIPR